MRWRALPGKTLRSLPYLIHRASSPLGRPPLRNAPPAGAADGAAGRILAIKLDAIGDLLMTTPALRALRRRFPAARIDLLVQPGVAPLARLVPFVDRVETLPCQFLLGGKNPLPRAGQWLGALMALRRRRYGLAVDFTGLFHSAFAAWASGAPLRLGFRRRIPLGFFSTEGFGHFYTHEFDTDEGAHLADCMGLLAGAAGAGADGGGWEVDLPPRFRSAAKRVLEQAAPGSGPLVAVHPGAKWPPKRWSMAALAETIDLLQGRGLRAVLIPGPGDGDLAETIRRAAASAPPVVWPPQPLEVVAGMLAEAGAFLGHDSGPMHIAAAVRTPGVALFGPTRPQRCGPRGSPFTTLYAALECSPCALYFTRDHCHRGHNYCMDGFRPDGVARAVEAAVRGGERKKV